MVKLCLPSLEWVVRWLCPFRLEKQVFRWQFVHVRWTARQLRRNKTDVNSLLQSMWSPMCVQIRTTFLRHTTQPNISQPEQGAVMMPNSRACLPLTTHELTFLLQLSKTSPLRQPLSVQLLRNPNITPFHCVLNIYVCKFRLTNATQASPHLHSKRINGKWECVCIE